jgi:hypothetical protein
MRRAFLASALGVLLLAPAAALARGTMTTGFRAPKARPASLAVLPPRADFIRSKAVVTPGMRDECAALEREAGVAVRTNLEMLGYQVRLLTARDLEGDARLRDLVERVNGRFGEEWKRIVRGPDVVRQGRAAAGDDAVRLAALLDVHGLVLTRVTAVTQGDEKKAQSYGRVDVGVASGQAGRIEAFFTGLEAASFGQLTGRPAKVMARATETAMSRCPSSTEAGAIREEMELPASEKAGRSGLPPTDAASLHDFGVLIKGSSAPGQPGRSAGSTAGSAASKPQPAKP